MVLSSQYGDSVNMMFLACIKVMSSCHVPTNITSKPLMQDSRANGDGYLGRTSHGDNRRRPNNISTPPGPSVQQIKRAAGLVV